LKILKNLHFQDFHEEYASEAFRRFDKESSGCISVDDFVLIMTSIRSHLLTPQVASKLGDVTDLPYNFN